MPNGAPFPDWMLTSEGRIDCFTDWLWDLCGNVACYDVTIVDQGKITEALEIHAQVVFPQASAKLSVDVLKFLDVEADEQVGTYRFDFRHFDPDSLIWRHDRHDGHQEAHGGWRTHRHLLLRSGGRAATIQVRQPEQPVTLESLLTEILEYLSQY